eukprot:2119620-Alexandrium_andersonii.AAC.1
MSAKPRPAPVGAWPQVYCNKCGRKWRTRASTCVLCLQTLTKCKCLPGQQNQRQGFLQFD